MPERYVVVPVNQGFQREALVDVLKTARCRTKPQVGQRLHGGLYLVRTNDQDVAAVAARLSESGVYHEVLTRIEVDIDIEFDDI